jgi:ribosome-binding factor A
MSDRMEKINFQVRREMADIIRDEIDDPTVGMISVMRVITASDLSQCRVYVSVFPETQSPHALEVLTCMKGRIRTILGSRIRLRHIPDVIFFIDEVIKESIIVHDKLEELKGEIKKSNRDL